MDYTGQVIDGKYTLKRLLAKGGMGMVYLGQHNVINRRVAVKVLHGKYQKDDNMVRRFYREAQAASAIEHKNIIEIIDVGTTEEGVPFLVMEYLEGESLSDLLKRTGPINIAAACGIMEPVLNALGAAHEKGVFHRDLKPENIFIVHSPKESPTIKLIDFGISKIQGDDSLTKLTQTGAIIGTPLYMAPEQLQAYDSVDHRADLYAIGVICYEMLTGALPYEGENANQMLAALLTKSPRPPESVYAGFPAEAEALVMKALAKAPEDRFQSVEEFITALRELGEFNERGERLTQYTAGIQTKRIAAGDIGSMGGHDSDGNSTPLSDLVSRPTPGEWNKSASASPRRATRFLWPVLGVAAAAAVTIAVAFLTSGSQPSKETAPQPKPIAPAKAGAVPDAPAQPVTKEPVVEIELSGVPKAAVITYDGMIVDINPFPVKRAHTIKKLKIEADGFKPYIKGIVPTKSQKILVSLTPIPSPESPETAVEKAVTPLETPSTPRQETSTPRQETSTPRQETSTPRQETTFEKKAKSDRNEKKSAGSSSPRRHRDKKNGAFIDDF